MKYHFKIHRESQGFWAECVELQGCVTQATTKNELWDNMQEALSLYLQEPADSEFLAALPNDKLSKKTTLVQVTVDPEVAFAFMVRYHRLKKNLTQKEAAKKMGFKSLYSYQRLEKKCNATLEMIAKIKDIFPDFSIDLAFS